MFKQPDSISMRTREAEEFIADVLDTLAFAPNLHFQAAIGPDFSLRVQSSQRTPIYLSQGEPFWLSFPDLGREIEVCNGDVVLLSRCAPHVIHKGRTDAPMSLADIVQQGVQKSRRTYRLSSADASTTLVGSFYWARDFLAHPLTASLPEIVHINGSNTLDAEWIGPIGALMRWATNIDAGNSGIGMAGWSNALIRNVVNQHCLQQVHLPGLIRGIRDQAMLKVLAAVHADPARDWSVAEMAAQIHMSRTAFVNRFGEVMGMPPMRYLLTWRMYLAKCLLADERHTLDEIAARTGYADAFAFSKAYKRHSGESPSGRTAAL